MYGKKLTVKAIVLILKCCSYGSVYSEGWTTLKMLDISHLKHCFPERNTKKVYRFQEGKKRRHVNTGKLIVMNVSLYLINIFYRPLEIKTLLKGIFLLSLHIPKYENKTQDKDVQRAL